jgi:methylmalonyl-CoA/ethylmalonyl-CoA epimerase
MPITSLHQVAQHADDLDRATAFYRDVLGLRHLASFDPPGLTFFDLHGTRLLLERGAPAALLYLGVDDIEAAADELAGRGVQFEHVPHLIHRDDDGRFGPPGNETWTAFFRDSEGNLLGLAAQRGPS